MERYYPSTSEEFKAQAHIAEYIYWDFNIGAKEIGLCAAYASLNRYVKGEDLYLPPRNAAELQQILRNYSDHVINSLCSQVVCRVSLRQSNGWAQAREYAARSLRRVLSQDDNLQRLVILHSPPAVEPTAAVDDHSFDVDEHVLPSGCATPRHIRTQ